MGLGCHPIVPVIMRDITRPGLTHLVYPLVSHDAPTMGVVLEGRGVVLGVEDMVELEVGVAYGGLWHKAAHCTWGLVVYIIGGRFGLVGVSHYSFLASHMAMLSVDQLAIYQVSKEGVGKSNLKK